MSDLESAYTETETPKPFITPKQVLYVLYFFFTSNLLHSVINEKCAQFHLIQCLDDVKKSPKLLASVVVQEDFGFNAFMSSVLVPPKLYKHIMSSDTGILKKMSEFCNSLAFCKALTTSSINDGSDNSHGISLAVSALESYLCSKTETQDKDLPQPLLQFIIEQLQQIHVPKNGQRYSTSLLMTSFLWQLTSSSLYKKLRSFFILPSISQLRRLSSTTAVESRTRCGLSETAHFNINSTRTDSNVNA